MGDGTYSVTLTLTSSPRSTVRELGSNQRVLCVSAGTVPVGVAVDVGNDVEVDVEVGDAVGVVLAVTVAVAVGVLVGESVDVAVAG